MTALGEALRDSTIINLERALVMVVDDEPFSLELTVQALQGFGARTRYACSSAAKAMEILRESEVDLLVTDCEMPDMDGYDLVRWLRRSNLESNAFVPVIMTAGHVKRSKVEKARDCGANFLVTKPFSAATLLERIVWVAKDTRPFLQTGAYFGPDRRFRDGPLPEGGDRRAGGRKPGDEPEGAVA